MFQQGQIRSRQGNRFVSTPEPWWVSYRNVYLPQCGCAGTGVFLPRGDRNVALKSRGKSGRTIPPVSMPDHGGLIPDVSLNHHEACLLPQEWTY